jgi:hypothetical protein
MTTVYYPILCGGTFFTLLLEARKARVGKKAQIYACQDELSEMRLLVELVKIIYPEYEETSNRKVQSTITSDYKTCHNNGSNLPFGRKAVIDAFDDRIHSDYQQLFKLMTIYVNRFIDIGGSIKADVRLVKALMDLIYSDQSIRNDERFFVCGNDSPLTKKQVCLMTSVCLPAFLLGIYHYIVMNRPINTIGRETINKWCPENNSRRRIYTGSMGSNITQEIIVILDNESHEIQERDTTSVSLAELPNPDSFIDTLLQNIYPQNASNGTKGYKLEVSFTGVINIEILSNDDKT